MKSQTLPAKASIPAPHYIPFASGFIVAATTKINKKRSQKQRPEARDLEAHHLLVETTPNRVLSPLPSHNGKCMELLNHSRSPTMLLIPLSTRFTDGIRAVTFEEGQITYFHTKFSQLLNFNTNF